LLANFNKNPKHTNTLRDREKYCIEKLPLTTTKNCVDYVAHTCAVPEGRAATENVGDRQEWFKTDFLGFFFFFFFFAVVSLLLLLLYLYYSIPHSSYLLEGGFGLTLLPPPLDVNLTLLPCISTSSYQVEKTKKEEEGKVEEEEEEEERGGETTLVEEEEKEKKDVVPEGGKHTGTEEDGRGRPTGHRPYTQLLLLLLFKT
jgi:hypothetical protein